MNVRGTLVYHEGHSNRPWKEKKTTRCNQRETRVFIKPGSILIGTDFRP